MHRHQIGFFEGFWNTGIWVILRIMFLPALIFCGFYYFKAAEINPMQMGLSSAFGQSNQALSQINSSINSLGLGGSAGKSRSISTPGPGAKWIRP